MSQYYLEIDGEKWWRYGKIVVDGKIYFKSPDLVYEALAKIRFLPIKTEHDLFYNQVILHGFSPAFKLVKRGEKAIEYQIQIDCRSVLTGELYNIKVTEGGVK